MINELQLNSRETKLSILSACTIFLHLENKMGLL